jgi:hypothetical protein
MVLLKGADFPALPTSAPDPRAAPGHGDAVDAVGEEPLAFALAAVAARGAPARPRPPGVPSRGQAPPPRRWTTVVAAGTVALATLGAGFLLLVGGPNPGARPAAPAPIGASATTTPGGEAPDPHAAPSSATRPAAPSTPPAPSSQEGGGAAPPAMDAPTKAVQIPRAVATASPAPSSPAPRPAPLPPAKRAAAPVARKGPGPSAPGAAAAAPPAAASAPEAPSAAAARATADQVVAQAVAARRPAFDACVREWAREEPGLWVPGRRVDLLLTVQPSGTVTSPRIDDPALEGTALAGCLRGAAGKPFPPFDGDPVQLRIPFRLGE